MKARGRGATSIVLAAVCGLLAVDTAAWWWLSNQVLAGFADWEAGQRARGLQVVAGPPARAGWPWQAGAVVPNLSIATANGAAWHTGELRLVFRPWRPGVFTATPIGPQVVRVGSTQIELTARQMAATIPLQLGLMTVEAHGLVGMLGTRTVSVEQLVVGIEPTRLSFAATSLTLPKAPPGSPPLPMAGTIAGTLQANEPLLPAPDWPSTLAEWQRRNGRLDLTGFTMQWGPLDARGTASLALTPGLQPEGTGQLQLTGYDDALAALQHSGSLSSDAAKVASAVLGLLARHQPGQAPEVDLPLRLHAGTLSAGAVPLLRVPDFIPE